MGIFSSGLGIDFSDHHVRIARVSHGGKPLGLFELVLPSGLIHDDTIIKPKHLKKELGNLLQKAGIQDLNDPTFILVPESRVFSTSFVVSKKLKKDELVKSATLQAQKDIPIPFSGAEVGVHKGLSVEGGVRVGVNVVRKDLVKSIVDSFSLANFSLSGLEANNAALNRLFREYSVSDFELKDQKALLMIVDVGHRWTNITLYDKMNTLVYSRSIALRQLKDTSRGKVKKISKQMIEKICNGISETINYFEPLGAKVPFAVVAGVEGAQEPISQQCSKRTKGCIIRRIGEMVDLGEVSPEDVHSYGAAIGAGYRAARQSHFSKDYKISLNDYVQKQ